jgi:hypothetical protein
LGGRQHRKFDFESHLQRARNRRKLAERRIRAPGFECGDNRLGHTESLGQLRLSDAYRCPRGAGAVSHELGVNL